MTSQTHRAGPGDPFYQTTLNVVELLAEATDDFVTNWHDEGEALSIVGAAAAVFAGQQVGQLVASGTISGTDYAAAMQAACNNFREGFEAGAGQ